MGITRKILSISTLGLVPYRNREERQLRYARQTRNAARASVAFDAAQLQELRGIRDGVDHHNIVEMQREIYRAPFGPMTTEPAPHPDPGWYQDHTGKTRWWDGLQWTDVTQ